MPRPPRRPGAAALVVATWAAALLIPGVARSQPAPGSWPMAGGDAAHTASAEGPAPPYRELWSVEPPELPLIAPPVTSGDRVLVLAQGAVLALDAADGRVLWQQPRGSGPAGAAAIAGETVVHASGGGTEARLLARRLKDGAEVWSAEIGQDLLADLVVSDDLLVASGREGLLVGVDPETGEERWRFEAPGDLETTPMIAGETVVAVASESASSTVFAVNAAEPGDAPLWEVPLPALATPPTLSGNSLVVGVGDGRVLAIDVTGGEERWATSSRGPFGEEQMPAGGDGVVLADLAHLSRLDGETGEELWTYLLADLRSLGETYLTLERSAPTLVGGAAVIGDAAGTMSAVDLESGRLVWRGDLGEGELSAIAADGQRLFVIGYGEEGRVVALEHDPEGALLDEISPTVLFPGTAILNFAVAAIAVGLVTFGLFGFVLRPRRTA